MTDRVSGIVVTLDKDYRDDDVEAVLDAIRMIKGVASVKTNVVSVNDHINREKIRFEMSDKLLKALREEYE
jgi:hypothetical protein